MYYYSPVFQNIMKLKNIKTQYKILAVVTILWIIAFPHFKEEFITNYSFMPLLGIVAATVANTTPAAAGIVYFPILTKLKIDPFTAFQFSLIIQAYGMSLGAFKWYKLNKNLFLKSILPICIIGGMTGASLSIVVFPLKNPELLTLTFNSVAFIFTQIIFFSILFKFQYPYTDIEVTKERSIIFFIISMIGGIISGWIGFGIDTIFYFVLTIGFKINPAISIVTSISLMAATSIYGTILNIIFNNVPFALWYSAIPGVTLAGLFIASFIAIKIGAKNVLLLFTFFLCADFFLTLWTQQTLPMSQTLRTGITYALVIYLLAVHVKIFKQSYNDMTSNLGKFKEQIPAPVLNTRKKKSIKNN